MKRYDVTISRSARKELENLEDNLIESIFSKIDSLIINPHPTGSEKIKGSKNYWRIRIGDYRVIYSINKKSNLVEILTVRHRKDVYR